ncbi:MAG: integrase core domain-containing protein [Proteobacteria bacterium]|nr:integrase core domain-containing protein [Pseudomonadota bacterium]
MNAPQLQFLILVLAGWINRSQQNVIDYLQEENRILREKLGEKRPSFTDSQRRRLAAKAKLIGRQGLFEIDTVVTPDTLLRWYRKLIANKYDGSAVRRPGRPKTADEIEQLILQMARSNPSWGYTRIRGALYNLGHELGRNTIKQILLDNGFDPAPFRNKGMSWATFLKAHWGAIAATDFFSVEVLTRKGLVRYFVLFVIDLQTRRVKIAGIVQQPDGQWMRQIARNLSDVDDGSLNRCRYLIHDRDPLFTEAFRKILKSTDVETIKLPARSPNLNAYAERFVRSIKSECLEQLIPLGEHHLRKAVIEYTKHYHFERNHQGLDNRLITKPRDVPDLTRAVECRERLGGILNYYYREAA